MKWWTGSKVDLYHVMIYMFLSPTDELGENQLFSGQKTLQVSPLQSSSFFLCEEYQYSSYFIFFYQLVLLGLALVSVPWMLLPKPFLMKKQHEAVCLWTSFY